MKVFIKIFIVCVAVTVFYGCGSNESERKVNRKKREYPKPMRSMRKGRLRWRH